jgi:alanyl-tRNA synthetase
MAGFERAMAAQKERARAASHFGAGQAIGIDLEGETDFSGYEDLEDQGTVVGLYVDGEAATGSGQAKRGSWCST